MTSDYVQASEAELLGAVIKWGEMSVARRGETAPSGELITLPHPGRRGGRRREGVCDREVAEAVCDLVGCVRLEHLLPPGGEEIVKQVTCHPKDDQTLILFFSSIVFVFAQTHSLTLLAPI